MLSVQYLHGSCVHKREKSINSCLPVVALSPSLPPSLPSSLFFSLARAPSSSLARSRAFSFSVASDEIITVLTGIRGLPLCIAGAKGYRCHLLAPGSQHSFLRQPERGHCASIKHEMSRKSCCTHFCLHVIFSYRSRKHAVCLLCCYRD